MVYNQLLKEELAAAASVDPRAAMIIKYFASTANKNDACRITEGDNLTIGTFDAGMLAKLPVQKLVDNVGKAVLAMSFFENQKDNFISFQICAESAETPGTFTTPNLPEGKEHKISSYAQFLHSKIGKVGITMVYKTDTGKKNVYAFFLFDVNASKNCAKYQLQNELGIIY